MDEGYLLTATPPDLERGVAPLGPSVPTQPPLLGHGVVPLSRACAPLQPPTLVRLNAHLTFIISPSEIVIKISEKTEQGLRYFVCMCVFASS